MNKRCELSKVQYFWMSICSIFCHLVLWGVIDIGILFCSQLIIEIEIKINRDKTLGPEMWNCFNKYKIGLLGIFEFK